MQGDEGRHSCTVSVVIPVYNRNEILADAVRSALAQTYANIEVIVVDDCSTVPIDGSLASISDDRLKVIRRERNGGAGAARNTGIRAATGDYIAFLDSDDEWFPEKLERQMEVLAEAAQSQKPISAVTCGFLIHKENGGAFDYEDVRMPQPALGLERLVWGCDLSPGSTLVVSREAFLETGEFDESFSRFEDWEWLIRFVQAHQIAAVDQCLCRINVGTRPDADRVKASSNQLLAAHGKRFRDISFSIYMRFVSTIQLEKCAAYWHDGKYPGLIFYGVLALIAWPFRDFRFYWNGLKRFCSTPPVRVSSNKTRVLHIINSLGPGGAERMLTNVVVGTQSEELEHHVISLKKDDFYAPTLRAADVECTILSVKNVRSALEGLITISKLIRSTKPDIISGWMYHSNVFAFFARLLSGEGRRTSLIWGIRCSLMQLEHYGRQLRLVVGLSRHLSTFPDLIVANSFQGRSDHIALGFRRSRFAVIHNGFDTTRFAPSDAERARMRAELNIQDDVLAVGVVARNDPMKNYPLLLGAVKDMPGVVCVAVGLETDELPEQDNLIALGLRNDIPQIMCGFDVLVSCSSFGEGMSNSIGEAMSCAVPVIATDIGDSKHLVAKTGIVIPPDDKAALEEAIARLRDDPALRRNLGRQARERIEKDFSIEASREEFRRLFLTGAFGDRPC